MDILGKSFIWILLVCMALGSIARAHPLDPGSPEAAAASVSRPPRKSGCAFSMAALLGMMALSGMAIRMGTTDHKVDRLNRRIESLEAMLSMANGGPALAETIDGVKALSGQERDERIVELHQQAGRLMGPGRGELLEQLLPLASASTKREILLGLMDSPTVLPADAKTAGHFFAAEKPGSALQRELSDAFLDAVLQNRLDPYLSGHFLDFEMNPRTLAPLLPPAREMDLEKLYATSPSRDVKRFTLRVAEQLAARGRSQLLDSILKLEFDAQPFNEQQAASFLYNSDLPQDATNPLGPVEERVVQILQTHESPLMRAYAAGLQVRSDPKLAAKMLHGLMKEHAETRFANGDNWFKLANPLIELAKENPNALLEAGFSPGIIEKLKTTSPLSMMPHFAAEFPNSEHELEGPPK